jgi:hypothetical protein
MYENLSFFLFEKVLQWMKIYHFSCFKKFSNASGFSNKSIILYK